MSLLAVFAVGGVGDRWAAQLWTAAPQCWDTGEMNGPKWSCDGRPRKVHQLCQLHKLLVAHYGGTPRGPIPPLHSRARPRLPATHQYSLKAQLAECIAPREGAPLLSKWNITKMSFVKISPKTVGSGRAGSPRRRAPAASAPLAPDRARLPRGAARVAPAVASVRPGSSRASRCLPSLPAASISQQTLRANSAN